MIKTFKPGSWLSTLKQISPHVIHLGVIFIIVGYCASQTMVTQGEGIMRVGESMGIGDYEITLVRIEIVEDTGDIESDEYWDTWNLHIDIYKDGELVDEGYMSIVMEYWQDSLGYKHYISMVNSNVYIKRRILEDIHMVCTDYMSAHGMEDEFVVSARINPLMNVLWGGMVLFCLGMVVRTVVDYVLDKRTSGKVEAVVGKEEAAQRKAFKDGRDDAYYEKLLEEELRKSK